MLHLIDSAGLYGAEKVLISLVSNQSSEDIVSVVGSIGTTGEDKKAIEQECEKLDYPVVSFQLPARFSIRSIRCLTRYIKNNRIDLVHSHGYKPTILLGFLTNRMRGARMLATMHGFTGGGIKMLGYQIIDTIARRFLDAVVFVSATMIGSSHINCLPNPKTIVIPNGISEKSGSCKISRELELLLKKFKGDSFMLVSVGRLSAEKQVPLLVEALRDILDRGVNAKLLIVGEGGQRSFIENKITELNLSDFVLMIGYQSEIPSILEFGDIFVLPSKTEGSPVSVLEAMRVGLPIVATTVGALPSMLSDREDAYLVEKGDKECLVKRIIELLQVKSKRDDFSFNIKKKFRKYYTEDKMVSEYHSLYRELVAPNNITSN